MPAYSQRDASACQGINRYAPPQLLVRDRQPEWMDDPHLESKLHWAALAGLRRVNGVSRTAEAVWRTIQSHTRRGDHLRILDVASGGGDVAIRLMRRAARQGVVCEILGIDISRTALEFASHVARDSPPGTAARGSRLEFRQGDVLRDSLPGPFDVVYCTLFLHHLSDEDAVVLLRKMRAAAGRLMILDDLRRTRWGHTLARYGARFLTRSPVVHVDGPRSVRAAFTLREIRRLADEAGLQRARIRTRWPQRFHLSWSPMS